MQVDEATFPLDELEPLQGQAKSVRKAFLTQEKTCVRTCGKLLKRPVKQDWFALKFGFVCNKAFAYWNVSLLKGKVCFLAFVGQLDF